MTSELNLDFLNEQPNNRPLVHQVSHDGQRTAKIIIVGESPGKKEVLEGLPFVGPAGKMLWSALESAGIFRRDCYVTNVSKRMIERPEMEKINKYISGKKIKEPDLELEVDKWLSELRREIAMCEASLIIPLGNFALYACTGKHGITKYRGSILDTFWEGKKALPTIHPSATFSNYIFTHFMYFDLHRVPTELKIEGLGRPERNILLAPSMEETCNYLEAVSKDRDTAFDIEVIRCAQGNWEVSCLAFSRSPSDAICIPFIDKGGGDYYDPEQEFIVWKLIREVLESPSVVKIGQNAIAFDYPFLLRKYRIITRNIEDTLVGMGCLYPDFPKGLDFITSIYTREPYYKDEGKQYKSITNYEEFWRYNAKDAMVCHEAMPQIKKDLMELGNYEVYKAHMGLYEPLLYLHNRGLRISDELLEIDPETGLRKKSVELQREIDRLVESLESLTGQEGINPLSPKQLKELFYEQLGYTPIYKRKPGGSSITTDAKALKKLATRGSSEAGIILDIRKTAKLLGTYYNMQFDSDNRLRSSMNPVGTETGRLSSSKTIFGTGGNIQTLPPAFKPFVIANPNHIIFNVDLSQAENRIVAFIAPEPTMLRAFAEGIDIHSLTASGICGLTPGEVKGLNKKREDWNDADGPCPEEFLSPLGNGQKTWRYWGKQANHSLNYGLQPKHFAENLEIPLRDATVIHSAYHKLYPGVADYWRWIEAKVRQDRKIVNPFGRVRWYKGRIDHDLLKQALAQIPQSTVADIINRHGLIPMYHDAESPACILNQVHDSIVFEIDLKHGFEKMAACLQKLKTNLEQPIRWRNRELSIPADIKVGISLGKMLSCEADAGSIEDAYRKLTA